MPLITFKPSGKSVTLAPGTNLLEAARKAEIDIESPCGGEGACGKCLIRIVSGEVDSDCLGILSEEAIDDGYVLACKTQVLSSPLTIDIPEQIGWIEGQLTTDSESIKLINQDLLPKPVQYDPIAAKYFLQVVEPKLEDGLSDLDRLTHSIQQKFEKQPVRYSLPAMRDIAETLRTDQGKVTVTMINELDSYDIINIESRDHSAENYGIAIDVGTTTVAVKLVSLSENKILTTLTDYNDQISCGQDVISRINYAQRPEGLEELRSRVLNTINRLIHNLSEGSTISSKKFYNCVVAGNTTMIHLLLGLIPEYIRREPYTPTLLTVPYVTAEQVGIDINPLTWIYFAPAVGSYVGGDITSGLLCTDLSTQKEDITLFIDIGTNGELVIGNCDFLLTCACSAGPAFEGGGIESGMRAAPGAIDRIEIDAETGLASYQTIGNVRPMGICGSGMISLLANLFLSGWIDAAGKLNRSRKSQAIHLDRRNAYYTIVPGEKSQSGKAITINELNIENIIRAKAAIYSACSLMLEQVGMDFNHLTRVYIAGGFGRYIDLEKAIIIGLIPDLPRERFHYIGNASLIGAYMTLLSKQHRQRQIELSQRMTYVELNTDPTYMNQYVGAMFLPHTDKNLFPSVHSLLKKSNKNAV
jgi:uncharacterized 2Fe-2S/4Fe-4S cluster protein (DUF4445 family)